MIDTHTHRDHRREAAMATGCRQAAQRGFDFRSYNEQPIWIRALEECFRVRSLFLFAVIGAVASVWFW